MPTDREVLETLQRTLKCTFTGSSNPRDGREPLVKVGLNPVVRFFKVIVLIFLEFLK